MKPNHYVAASELDRLRKRGEEFCRELAVKIGPLPNRRPETLQLCVEHIRRLVLSDRVGFIFNISAVMENGRLILAGESERPEFRDIVCGVFRQLGFRALADRIEIVPDLKSDPAPFAVGIKAGLMTWVRPDLSGVPMDEILFGEPVYVFKESRGVSLVKNGSGYWGYAAAEGLRRVSRWEFVRLLNAPKALLLADRKARDGIIPAGCRLRVKAWGRGRTCVLLDPFGADLEVPKAVCRRNGRAGEMTRVILQARSFLKRPYRLGGRNSAGGIDCSALVQSGYRVLGLNLARDAKQQYLSGNLIMPCVQDALLPGDAVFFINSAGQVDHTGLYIGRRKFIHAQGECVKIQSMNPEAKDYFPRFDREFIGAKRYWW